MSAVTSGASPSTVNSGNFLVNQVDPFFLYTKGNKSILVGELDRSRMVPTICIIFEKCTGCFKSRSLPRERPEYHSNNPVQFIAKHLLCHDCGNKLLAAEEFIQYNKRDLIEGFNTLLRNRFEQLSHPSRL
jgi:hypothetical protein